MMTTLNDFATAITGVSLRYANELTICNDMQTQNKMDDRQPKPMTMKQREAVAVATLKKHTDCIEYDRNKTAGVAYDCCTND